LHSPKSIAAAVTAKYASNYAMDAPSRAVVKRKGFLTAGNETSIRENLGKVLEIITRSEATTGFNS